MELQASANGATIDCIVRSIQQALKPMRVMKGGSEGKNTAVEGSDIDLVVVLDDFDHKSLDHYWDLARIGIEGGGIVVVREEKRLLCGRAIVVHRVGGSASETAKVDILFTGDPDDNRHGNPPPYYDCYRTLEQVEYVKRFKAKFPLLHATIISLKQAVYNHVSQDVPGYYLELLCIKEFSEYGPDSSAESVVHHQVREKQVFTIECPVVRRDVWCPEPHRSALNALWTSA